MNSDVRKFPFDKQACPIQISSWALSSSMLDLSINSSSIKLNRYTENPNWILDSVSTSVKNNTKRFGYVVEDYMYQEVSVILNLSRRPLSFMVNNVFPCLILNILIVLAFGIPPGPQAGLSIDISLLFKYPLYTNLSFTC